MALIFLFARSHMETTPSLYLYGKLNKIDHFNDYVIILQTNVVS